MSWEGKRPCDGYILYIVILYRFKTSVLHGFFLSRTNMHRGGKMDEIETDKVVDGNDA